MRYIPIALYTIGLCHYGKHGKPFKTEVVAADNIQQAMKLARATLKPSTVQTVCWVRTEPNPAHVKKLRAAGLI